LRWGADPSGGAPYVFTDPANPDNYIGYEKEMVDALAAAMGRRAEFIPAIGKLSSPLCNANRLT
jgi:polar amino acid transport system substrate-binding protein